MRGKGKLQMSISLEARITPAYAGKSVYFLFLLCFIQDHPRLCGEKPSHISQFFGKMGSPPPMRGKAAGLSVSPTRTGITPAYAGKREFGMNLRILR